MKNKFGSIFMKCYLSIRKIIGKLLNKCYSKKYNKDIPDIDFEKDYASLEENKFRQKIMSYPYKWDPLKGLIDFTFSNPKFFFGNINWGRDCDDFSYMWYLWAVFNGLKVWQYAVMPGFNITRAHMICIIQRSQNFHIFDYSKIYTGDTIENVLEIYFKSRYKLDGYKSISYSSYLKPISITKAREIIK